MNDDMISNHDTDDDTTASRYYPTSSYVVPDTINITIILAGYTAY